VQSQSPFFPLIILFPDPSSFFVIQSFPSKSAIVSFPVSPSSVALPPHLNCRSLFGVDWATIRCPLDRFAPPPPPSFPPLFHGCFVTVHLIFFFFLWLGGGGSPMFRRWIAARPGPLPPLGYYASLSPWSTTRPRGAFNLAYEHFKLGTVYPVGLCGLSPSSMSCLPQFFCQILPPREPPSIVF